MACCPAPLPLLASPHTTPQHASLGPSQAACSQGRLLSAAPEAPQTQALQAASSRVVGKQHCKLCEGRCRAHSVLSQRQLVTKLSLLRLLRQQFQRPELVQAQDTKQARPRTGSDRPANARRHRELLLSTDKGKAQYQRTHNDSTNRSIKIPLQAPTMHPQLLQGWRPNRTVCRLSSRSRGGALQALQTTAKKTQQ